MRSILVVEDDASLQQMLRALLVDAGYQVHCARDGREALQVLHTVSEPCLILLDLLMPNMNGWEFRERQLAEPRFAAFPVVVMTATDSLEDAAIDALDLVRKPIDFRQLLRTIARYLAEDGSGSKPKQHRRVGAASRR